MTQNSTYIEFRVYATIGQAQRTVKMHLLVRAGAVAGVDLDRARLDAEAALVVVEADVGRVERPADRRLLARLERHPLEPAQPAHGLRERRDRVVDVELRDVVARDRPGVGHVDGRGDRPARVHDRRGQAQVVDLERRVAEAVAELVERRAGADVAVARVVLRRRVTRTAGRLVVVVDRDLADVARERDRQLAAGVDLAEEHVGDAVARLDAAEPGLEDRRRGRVDLAAASAGAS